MRNTRLLLAGASLLALLVATVGAVMALDDEAATPEWTTPERGLVYGEDDPTKQVIHVYGLESREAPRPAVLLIHGGALVIGSPDDYASMIPPLRDMGYVVFNAGYRLFDAETGANPWPAQLEDVQQAVRWIREHADEYGVDPDRLCAIGHSSGGQLAGLLGTTDAQGAGEAALEATSTRVDCVVSLAGDMDLLVPYDYPDFDLGGLTGLILGGTVEERPDVWMAASPAHNVDEHASPSLVIHGSADAVVPVEMSRNFVDALNEAGTDVVYAEYSDQDHESVLRHRPAWALIDAFLRSELQPDR